MATKQATTKFRPLPVVTRELLEATALCERLRHRPDGDEMKSDARMQRDIIIQRLHRSIGLALDAVNGSAGTFTIYQPAEVNRYAEQAEAMLKVAGIPESERPGTVVVARPAGPWANAYKSSGISTQVTLQRRPKGVWMLASVERVTVWPKTPELYRVQISAAAAECARKAALRPFTVREPGLASEQRKRDLLAEAIGV